MEEVVVKTLETTPKDATGKGGRRPAVATDKTDTVRTAYRERRSIAALARDHGVSRGAIRTAVADLMPDHNGITQEGTPALELPVTLDMPGKGPRPLKLGWHTIKVR